MAQFDVWPKMTIQKDEREKKMEREKKSEERENREIWERERD